MGSTVFGWAIPRMALWKPAQWVGPSSTSPCFGSRASSGSLFPFACLPNTLIKEKAISRRSPVCLGSCVFFRIKSQVDLGLAHLDGHLHLHLDPPDPPRHGVDSSCVEAAPVSPAGLPVVTGHVVSLCGCPKVLSSPCLSDCLLYSSLLPLPPIPLK